MKKHFIVSITEVNEETGETRELLNEDENKFKSVVLTGECKDEERCAEVLINTNLMQIAALIASGRKLSIAAKLAMVAMQAREERMSGIEDLLSSSIEGGIQ